MTTETESRFTFLSHQWLPKEKKATFTYKLQHKGEEFEFTEVLEFTQPLESVPDKLLKNVLDSLHLVLGISYYKLFCPRQIVLNQISLSKEQADFWNTVYTKGLGEFFYENKIDFRGLIKFPYSDKESSSVSFPRKNRSLVGVGGGKDSIVAGELLKNFGKLFSALVINTHPIREKAIELLEVDAHMVIREFDPLLFVLNERKDTYNGHVPVSSQYAFIGLLTAVLHDYKYIVMSNEESANYGSVMYLDQEINHQWSKSFEFEQLFQNYVKEYLTPDIIYFSLLRPFSEIGIAEKFANYPKYFPVFSSCNKNFRINNKAGKRWCGECPKCAFTFVMLSAFLPKDELINIFGQNLFSRIDMLEIYKELLGVSKIKPFDCVGTPEEVKVAFYLAKKRGEYKTEVVMEFFEKEILTQVPDIEILEKEVFKKSEKHSIPKEFQDALKT